MTMEPEDNLSSEFAPDGFNAIPAEVEETQGTEQDTPEQQFPPEVNADPYGLRALADEQRELVKFQREQAQRASQPTPAGPPPPLMEREDWKTAYFEAASASAYDPTAQMKLLMMNQELANESASNMQAQIRREMQAQFQVDTSMNTLRTEARSVLGDLVDDTTLNEVTNQVFGGDRTLMGNAMQDPSVRQLVIDAAAGRKMRTGKATPANAPARQTPPPSVQSSARDTKAGPATVNDYDDDAFADMWKNPAKYAAKRK